MNKYLVYTMIIICLIIGVLLIFGELEQYNTRSYILTKGVGGLAVYAAIKIYIMNKLTWLDKEK